MLRYKLGWIDGQLKVDQRITAVGTCCFDLVVASGKKRQVVESEGIAQTNGRLDKNGGVGEDGQLQIDNGITAAEIGESIGVRARVFVDVGANGETIAPTDFWKKKSERARLESELVLNEGVAAELVFEGVGEGGIAVMRESVVGPSISRTELQRLRIELFGIGLKLIPSKGTVAMKIALDFYGVLLSGSGIKQGI